MLCETGPWSFKKTVKLDVSKKLDPTYLLGEISQILTELDIAIDIVPAEPKALSHVTVKAKVIILIQAESQKVVI